MLGSHHHHTRTAAEAAFVAEVMAAVGERLAYTACAGVDTDVVIRSNPVHPSWGAGGERCEYDAAVRVDDGGTVVFWETLRNCEDQGEALGIGPGSASWSWGFGTLRELVESAAALHGLHIRQVVDRSGATW